VFMRFFTVLLTVPFPLTADLHAATVNDQGDGAVRGLIDLSPYRHGGIAT
jgi:hypothetical protein